MLSDGLYVVDYAAGLSTPDLAGSGLAALRRGKVLGTDRRGGVFQGWYDYNRETARSHVSLRLQIPPDGELVTGFSAGESGATIDIVAAIEPCADASSLTVQVAGRPLEVKLTYLGALPS